MEPEKVREQPKKSEAVTAETAIKVLKDQTPLVPRVVPTTPLDRTYFNTPTYRPMSSEKPQPFGLTKVGEAFRSFSRIITRIFKFQNNPQD